MSKRTSCYKPLTSLAIAVALGGLASCGGEPLDEGVGVTESPIINGTAVTLNGGTVAIYHRYTNPNTCRVQPGDAPFTLNYTLDDTWWPRPCSGKVIRVVPFSNYKRYYILTARHCVTLNGQINGNLPDGSEFDQSRRQVTMALAPGVLSTVQANGFMQVTGVPPASYPRADVHAAGLPTHAGDTGEDLAILWVNILNNAPFPVSSGRTPLYMGPTSALHGMTMKTQGYGRFVAGHCYNHATSGAGVLRSAQGHWIDGETDKTFTHPEFVNGVGQAGGDSGSSWMQQPGDLLLGVTSSAVGGAGGPNLARWIHQKLGYLYLVPDSQFRGPRRLFGSVGGEGAPVRYNFNEDSTRTRVTYDWSKKEIRVAGLCLTHEWTTPHTDQIVMRACEAAGSYDHQSQEWDLTWVPTSNGGVLKLTQGAGTRCLRTMASSVVGSALCSGASSENWKFITDDEPLANGL